MDSLNPELSHLDEKGLPKMVDVSAKPQTNRTAEAEAVVIFPEDAWAKLASNGFTTKKGAIFDVAIIAGTMALKRTSETIPFCHTIPIDGSSISITPDEGRRAMVVRCSVKTTARTGVEMEAMTGASAAGLTIYDMTKSLGLGIEMRSVRLISKTGGKSDFKSKDD
jgi:cyclic pyranopterin monophosphate synthase